MPSDPTTTALLQLLPGLAGLLGGGGGGIPTPEQLQWQKIQANAQLPAAPDPAKMTQYQAFAPGATAPAQYRDPNLQTPEQFAQDYAGKQQRNSLIQAGLGGLAGLLTPNWGPLGYRSWGGQLGSALAGGLNTYEQAQQQQALQNYRQGQLGLGATRAATGMGNLQQRVLSNAPLSSQPEVQQDFIAQAESLADDPVVGKTAKLNAQVFRDGRISSARAQIMLSGLAAASAQGGTARQQQAFTAQEFGLPTSSAGGVSPSTPAAATEPPAGVPSGKVTPDEAATADRVSEILKSKGVPDDKAGEILDAMGIRRRGLPTSIVSAEPAAPAIPTSTATVPAAPGAPPEPPVDLAAPMMSPEEFARVNRFTSPEAAKPAYEAYRKATMAVREAAAKTPGEVEKAKEIAATKPEKLTHHYYSAAGPGGVNWVYERTEDPTGRIVSDTAIRRGALDASSARQLTSVGSAESMAQGLKTIYYPAIKPKYEAGGGKWLLHQWSLYSPTLNPGGLRGRPDPIAEQWFTHIGMIKTDLLQAAAGNTRNLKLVNDLFGPHIGREWSDPGGLMARLEAFENNGRFDAIRSSILGPEASTLTAPAAPGGGDLDAARKRLGL